jgi:hypothetical protein
MNGVFCSARVSRSALLLATLAVAWLCCGPVIRAQRRQPLPIFQGPTSPRPLRKVRQAKLGLHISSSKAKFKLGERVDLKVTFSNHTSRTYYIIVYRKVAGVEACRLTVATKSGVPRRDFGDSGLPARSKREVVPLLPDTEWSYFIDFAARYRFLPVTAYTVQAVYDIPSAAEYTASPCGRDVLARERLNTSLASNKVVFDIAKPEGK